MKASFKVALSAAALVAMAGTGFAQQPLSPKSSGADPITKGTGAGPDSRQTGYSESGRGGTGGTGGGPTSNGTGAGTGTATGGPAGGFPDRQ